MIAVTRELYGEENDVDESAEVGIAVPATMGFLGLAFIGCALVISGLPPLSGFIAKFALLATAFNSSSAAVSTATWAFIVVLILAGLAAIISLTRAGIHAFWAPERTVPRIRLVELAPVIALLLLCGVQTIQAGPVMRYMRATAQSLHVPDDYIRGVLRPVTGRLDHSKGGA
jgi:multicomponent K+:H+ antiporter subunit D